MEPAYRSFPVSKEYEAGFEQKLSTVSLLVSSSMIKLKRVFEQGFPVLIVSHWQVLIVWNRELSPLRLSLMDV
ncbi:hypothetical protein AKJ16_DCAP17344 [Drosera capensis]